jgi:hypothetical protein
VSLHHSRQLFQVLEVSLLEAAELVPLPNTTAPFSLQEVKVVEIILKAMDNLNEFLSRYIIHTIIFSAV